MDNMWMLWLIPVIAFGFAVVAFYERVMRETPQSVLTAQTTQLIPLLLPQTGSAPEEPLTLCPDCWSSRSAGNMRGCTGRSLAAG
jgi:hypothetical protein